MTIHIPERVIAETLRYTGARTKKEAILIALEQINRRCRREQLAKRLHGFMPNFMTKKI